jgi:hypothetical protein
VLFNDNHGIVIALLLWDRNSNELDNLIFINGDLPGLCRGMGFVIAPTLARDEMAGDYFWDFFISTGFPWLALGNCLPDSSLVPGTYNDCCIYETPSGLS